MISNGNAFSYSRIYGALSTKRDHKKTERKREPSSFEFVWSGFTLTLRLILVSFYFWGHISLFQFWRKNICVEWWTSKSIVEYFFVDYVSRNQLTKMIHMKSLKNCILRIRCRDSLPIQIDKNWIKLLHFRWMQQKLSGRICSMYKERF